MNIEEKINEIARNMNPIDDIFFRKMAEYLPFCEEILQVILADKKLKVIQYNRYGQAFCRCSRCDSSIYFPL